MRVTRGVIGEILTLRQMLQETLTATYREVQEKKYSCKFGKATRMCLCLATYNTFEYRKDS